MKTNIAIDLEKNTVIVSNTFYKKASLYGTPEWTLLSMRFSKTGNKQSGF